MNMRGKTVVSGVALGAALAVALALAAVFGIKIKSPGTRTAPAAAPTTDSGPRTAVQAELDRALLAAADLPRAVPSRSPSPFRKPKPATEAAPSCRLLFDRPGEVAAAVPIAQSSRSFGGARQLLALYPGDTAHQAFTRLRTAATRCQARPVRAVRAEKVGDESYVARTPTGAIAVVRVGGAVTVLRTAGTLRDRDLMRLLHQQRGKLEVCPRCVSRSPR
jgi:hypothetical protein